MPAHLAAAASGPLQEVVICAEGHASTVWLDAEGNEHPAPQECRDCPLCHTPALTAGPEPCLAVSPGQWLRPAAPLAAAQVRGAGRPVLVLTRGPPSFLSAWTHAVPSPAGDCHSPDAAGPRQPMRGIRAIAMDARA
ncbi:hypothetical protein [Paracoccus sp. MKU1]|uniref:hypothetical protein n=1 Tax=Paracoccus sp. MKU1 TaxID=1745182 RepID=UPI00072AB646|nr:hypothetical protein [Paracoccus sp. MKU1]KRW96114.1 hypothetical protein AQY21_11045 [Paracoccus sp. MKU1]